MIVALSFILRSLKAFFRQDDSINPSSQKSLASYKMHSMIVRIFDCFTLHAIKLSTLLRSSKIDQMTLSKRDLEQWGEWPAPGDDLQIAKLLRR
jgi:hypothetical protein